MPEDREAKGAAAGGVRPVMARHELGEGGEQLLEKLVLGPGGGEAHLGLEGERGERLAGGLGAWPQRADLLDDAGGGSSSGIATGSSSGGSSGTAGSSSGGTSSSSSGSSSSGSSSSGAGADAGGVPCPMMACANTCCRAPGGGGGMMSCVMGACPAGDTQICLTNANCPSGQTCNIGGGRTGTCRAPFVFDAGGRGGG